MKQKKTIEKVEIAECLFENVVQIGSGNSILYLEIISLCG